MHPGYDQQTSTNCNHKMKTLFTLSLLLVSTISFGQFAIIADKDGFVNVRKDAQPNSKIIDTLHANQLVYCFENKGNWTNIDYTKKGTDYNAYVYKDRYTLISSFFKIPLLKRKENVVSLKKDTIEVSLSMGKFEKAKHKFKYYKEAPDQIEFIDNKKYWGQDGGIPNTQFDKIILTIGSKSITLPKKATEGLYEPNLNSAEVYFDKTNNTIFIQTMNSDGAGSYEVVWKIKDGVYIDRLIVYGF